jgi:ferredoxin
VLKLRELVGEFEKPKFFAYKQKLCAHSRNEQVGCNACIEICSAEAISSDKSRQQIKVNPNLCVGCGACTTVCPTGALAYAYPRTGEQGQKIRTLLSTYERPAARDRSCCCIARSAASALVEDLGRAARVGRPARRAGQRDPAGAVARGQHRPRPLAVGHRAGARHVAVLATSEEAPQYLDGLRRRWQVAQAILHGLGYDRQPLQLLQAATRPTSTRPAARWRRRRRSVPKEQRARFAVAAEKRTTLELALDHLVEQAPPSPKPSRCRPARPSATSRSTRTSARCA